MTKGDEKDRKKLEKRLTSLGFKYPKSKSKNPSKRVMYRITSDGKKQVINITYTTKINNIRKKKIKKTRKKGYPFSKPFKRSSRLRNYKPMPKIEEEDNIDHISNLLENAKIGGNYSTRKIKSKKNRRKSKKRRSRKCKNGKLKRPVKENGKTRYCKRSRRKSKKRRSRKCKNGKLKRPVKENGKTRYCKRSRRKSKEVN